MARKQDARKRKAEGKIKRKAKEEEKARERTEKRRKAKAAVATDDDESVMCNLCGTTDPSEEVGSDTLWVQCDTYFGYSVTPVVTGFISIVLG